jgi:hypothetical protein
MKKINFFYDDDDDDEKKKKTKNGILILWVLELKKQ